jgi:hypothetical protein
VAAELTVSGELITTAAGKFLTLPPILDTAQNTLAPLPALLKVGAFTEGNTLAATITTGVGAFVTMLENLQLTFADLNAGLLNAAVILTDADSENNDLATTDLTDIGTRYGGTR